MQIADPLSLVLHLATALRHITYGGTSLGPLVLVSCYRWGYHYAEQLHAIQLAVEGFGVRKMMDHSSCLWSTPSSREISVRPAQEIGCIQALKFLDPLRLHPSAG